MPEATVYVTIGNSDDKLSQSDWSEFVSAVRGAMASWGASWFGQWYSAPDAPFQNACFGASFDHDNIGALRASLTQVRELYRQDSLAFAVVDHTQLI